MQTTFDHHDNTLVSPQAVWQSLFACLAMVAILVVGVYYGFTYNAPPQTPQITRFVAEEEGNSLNFTWNVDHASATTITLERHFGSDQWVAVQSSPLAAADELSIASPHETATYRLVVRDVDGKLVQQKLVQIQ